MIAACAIGFAAWKGDCHGPAPVAEVHIRFAEICSQADQTLGEPAAIGFFLTEYDSWTREEIHQNLLPEVRLALGARQHKLGSPEGGTKAPQEKPVPIKPPKKMAASTDKEPEIREGKASSTATDTERLRCVFGRFDASVDGTDTRNFFG